MQHSEPYFGSLAQYDPDALLFALGMMTIAIARPYTPAKIKHMATPKSNRTLTRKDWRLGLLIVASGVAVPLAIAGTDSKAVLLGALIGLGLYQVRWRRPAVKEEWLERPTDLD